MEDCRGFGLTPEENWSSLVLVRVYRTNHIPIGEKGNTVPVGYVFVADFKKFGPNALWKLPGGHKCDADNTPLDTAVRELREEAGIEVTRSAFRHLGKYFREQPTPHWDLYFTATISEKDRDWMNGGHVGNQGEVPKFFSIEDLYALVQKGGFIRHQFDELVELGALLPMGRDAEDAENGAVPEPHRGTRIPIGEVSIAERCSVPQKERCALALEFLSGIQGLIRRVTCIDHQKKLWEGSIDASNSMFGVDATEAALSLIEQQRSHR